MIPNVKNLMMQGPRGYSGKDFVESSWKYLLRLEESYAALNVDSRAMVEEVVGMTFMSGGDFYYRFRAVCMKPPLASGPLPLECLQMIIRYVASDDDGTLAAFICTNKYVCSATLPIMYEKPLQLWRLIFEFSLYDDKFSKLLHLIRVLLRSVPKDRITPLLKAAYLDNDDQATVEPENEEQLTAATAVSNNNSNPTKISYLTFVTTIDIQFVFHPDTSIFYNPALNDNAHLSNELANSRLSEQYQAEGVNDRLKYYDADKVIHLGTARDLRRDLTWALSVNAENIRALTIPLADLARYLEQVHRFKVLADVTFLIDRDLRYFQRNGRELGTQDQEMLRFQRTQRIRQYEDMLSFVQKHRQIHTGVLRTGRCIPDKITSTKEYCPIEYHSRLWQSLPPLVKPRLIDSDSWGHFVNRMQDTDLSCVESLCEWISSNPEDASWSRLVKEVPFLHRCRALKEIDLVSLGDDIFQWGGDTFQWAVDERKQYVANFATGQTCDRPLVPLRRFRAAYDHLSAGSHLNDVLYAFNDTLEAVIVTGKWSSNQVDIHGLPEFLISSENENTNSFWGLPRLANLVVNSKEINLRIHSDFLHRCPRLKQVSLHDMRRNYSLEDTVYWKPAVLPELEYLYLLGTPALSFHPDTLWTTPELKSLHLGLFSSQQEATFIPPVEQLDAVIEQQQQHGEEEKVEASYNKMDNNNSSSNSSSNISLTTPLPRQPVWTWDWHLPKLTHLNLTSEFAYRFQFKMLIVTPSLNTLHLDTKTDLMEHKRTLSLEDLLLPEFQHHGLGEFLEQEKEKRCRRLVREQRPSDLENVQSRGELNREMEVDEIEKDEGEREEKSKIWRDFEYLRAYHLINFTMRGPWTLEGRRVLEVLFNKVAPNIICLTMKDCNGYNLSDVVETTSKYLHSVWRVKVSVHAPMDEVIRAGLEYVPGRENRDWESVLFRLLRSSRSTRNNCTHHSASPSSFWHLCSAKTTHKRRTSATLQQNRSNLPSGKHLSITSVILAYILSLLRKTPIEGIVEGVTKLLFETIKPVGKQCQHRDVDVTLREVIKSLKQEQDVESLEKGLSGNATFRTWFKVFVRTVDVIKMYEKTFKVSTFIRTLEFERPTVVIQELAKLSNPALAFSPLKSALFPRDLSCCCPETRVDSDS
ncbi:MAG: hypothetical protein J3R72DRAFT_521161 [Linnemannia gamsii]|nr:MAG: hypothetical protein J3R72DRAFT_521161 [Linnemannia gamsii]